MSKPITFSKKGFICPYCFTRQDQFGLTEIKKTEFIIGLPNGITQKLGTSYIKKRYCISCDAHLHESLIRIIIAHFKEPSK